MPCSVSAKMIPVLYPWKQWHHAGLSGNSCCSHWGSEFLASSFSKWKSADKIFQCFMDHLHSLGKMGLHDKTPDTENTEQHKYLWYSALGLEYTRLLCDQMSIGVGSVQEISCSDPLRTWSPLTVMQNFQTFTPIIKLIWGRSWRGMRYLLTWLFYFLCLSAKKHT